MRFKKLLLAFIYKVVCKLNLRQLPGGLFYGSLEYLETIIAAEDRRKSIGIGYIAFVRPGLYWFFGNDVVIYKHHESRSLKADILNMRWCRVGDLNMLELISMGAPCVTVNFKQDDLVEYMRRYISPDLDLDSWITVFYCKEESLRGSFLDEVVATFQFHSNLPKHSTE